jgi:hypothetical protein
MCTAACTGNTWLGSQLHSLRCSLCLDFFVCEMQVTTSYGCNWVLKCFLSLQQPLHWGHQCCHQTVVSVVSESPFLHQMDSGHCLWTVGSGSCDTAFFSGKRRVEGGQGGRTSSGTQGKCAWRDVPGEAWHGFPQQSIKGVMAGVDSGGCRPAVSSLRVWMK